MQNFYQQFQKEGIAKLKEELGIKNTLALPRLLKIVINVSLGEALTNKNAIEQTLKQVAVITPLPESLLLKRLFALKEEKFILVEGESRKIGGIQIPLNVWNQLQSAIKIKLNSPMQERIERLSCFLPLLHLNNNKKLCYWCDNNKSREAK